MPVSATASRASSSSEVRLTSTLPGRAGGPHRADRIREQVVEHPGEVAHGDPHLGRIGVPRARLEPHLGVGARQPRCPVGRGLGLLDQLVPARPTGVGRRLDARELEQVVREVGEPQHVEAGRTDVGEQRIRVARTGFRELEPPLQDRERGAQLVTGVRDHLPLAVGRGAQRADEVVQGRREVGQLVAGGGDGQRRGRLARGELGGPHPHPVHRSQRHTCQEQRRQAERHHDDGRRHDENEGEAGEDDVGRSLVAGRDHRPLALPGRDALGEHQVVRAGRDHEVDGSRRPRDPVHPVPEPRGEGVQAHRARGVDHGHALVLHGRPQAAVGQPAHLRDERVGVAVEQRQRRRAHDGGHGEVDPDDGDRGEDQRDGQAAVGDARRDREAAQVDEPERGHSARVSGGATSRYPRPRSVTICRSDDAASSLRRR